MITALALGVLAIALAWPVPVLLARASWPAAAPAAALALWQAIAIAGGLSMIGSLAVFGLSPFGEGLLSGAVGFVETVRGVRPVGGSGPVGGGILFPLLAMGAAALLTAHLLLNLLGTVLRAERQRRRHADLVTLLSSPASTPRGARLIDTPAPVAYCLPGAVSSVTVVSAGLLELLDDVEVTAVIEHERAHVTQRHDIVLVLFRAWHASLPWFPIAFRARREVEVLIEQLADDHARRAVGDDVLARAIVLVGAREGTGGAEVAPLDRGHDGIQAVRHRVARLGPDAPRFNSGGRTLVLATAAALVIVPTVALLLPALTAA